MDWEVRDKFIEDMDLSNGFRAEMDKLVRRSVKKTADGRIDARTYTASEDQMQAVRDRITTGGRGKEPAKVEKNNREYIRVGPRSYKKFTREKDIAKTSDGRIMIRDEQGRYHETITSKAEEYEDNEES